MRVISKIRFSPALYMDKKTAVWAQFPLTFTVR
jgi:hypothetical protein